MFDKPAETSNLQNLVVLDLRENQLKEVCPEVFELPHLQRLELAGNQLTSLSDAIVQLPKLERLDLRNNPVSKAEQKRLQELLPGCCIVF